MKKCVVLIVYLSFKIYLHNNTIIIIIMRLVNCIFRYRIRRVFTTAPLSSQNFKPHNIEVGC